MDWGGAEKRRFVRADFPCSITIHLPKKKTISSHTENIGAGGLRVIISARLEIGDMVGLEIYLDDKPITCEGRVVWMIEKVNPISGKTIMYDIGIEFYKIDGEDQNIIKTLVEAIAYDKPL